MTYQMSWERTRNVWDEFDTSDFIQEQNNEYEKSNEIDFDFVEVPDFDENEIL